MGGVGGGAQRGLAAASGQSGSGRAWLAGRRRRAVLAGSGRGILHWLYFIYGGGSGPSFWPGLMGMWD
ncbi:MAG: hypothetical protein IPG51_14380 [Chloroflexi bacterium]|nr:hypothetical protein [Chloroflexota bacterium]